MVLGVHRVDLDLDRRRCCEPLMLKHTRLCAVSDGVHALQSYCRCSAAAAQNARKCSSRSQLCGRGCNAHVLRQDAAAPPGMEMLLVYCSGNLLQHEPEPQQMQEANKAGPQIIYFMYQMPLHQESELDRAVAAAAAAAEDEAANVAFRIYTFEDDFVQSPQPLPPQPPPPTRPTVLHPRQPPCAAPQSMLKRLMAVCACRTRGASIASQILIHH